MSEGFDTILIHYSIILNRYHYLSTHHWMRHRCMPLSENLPIVLIPKELVTGRRQSPRIKTYSTRGQT